MRSDAREVSDHAGAPEPLVSVSVTTYNHAPYIEQCIRSVLAQQTPFAVEIIIGDDCSTDGTREIVRTLQREHPDRIRLVLPERNLGNGGVPMFARTMRDVRGRYVAMMDGDDYWTDPHKLARQVAHLEAHPECTMCYHNVLMIWEDGSRPPRVHNVGPPAMPLTAEHILELCNIGSCSPMFPRDVIHPLPSWFETMRAGDLPLYIMAAERGRIDFIDEVMGVWRCHSSGEWGGRDIAGQQLLNAEIHARFDRATEGRYSETLSRLIRNCFYEASLHQSRAGDHAGAWRSAWRVMKLPFRRRPSIQYLIKEIAVSQLRAIVGMRREHPGGPTPT